ncbi:MAG: flagellar basal body-associated FliL family protein [Spirochaetota bacterium]|nr:flagellar basal body-associated FliL family protein [Spirochaetota bacterium]
MADEDLLEEGLEEGLKKSSPVAKILTTILGYLIPVLISVVISVIIMFVVFKGGTSKERNENAIAVQLQPKPVPLSYYDIGEFKINTADLDANYFVRVALSLGYNQEKKLLHAELVARHIQIRDVILNLLNSKEKNQIDEFLEKEQLKEEIRRTINSLFINGEIDAVYYTEFTIS